MQKISSNSGITLIVLIITIIILLLIAGIFIRQSITGSLPMVQETMMQNELNIIQQAIVQQYALAKAKGEIGIKTSETRPASFLGDIIINTSSIKTDKITDMYNEARGSEKWYEGDYSSNDFELKEMYFTLEIANTYTGTSGLTYDKLYYRLTKADLEALNIRKDVKNIPGTGYVVNYSTGEVYSEYEQIVKLDYTDYMNEEGSHFKETYHAKILYLPPIAIYEEQEPENEFSDDI